MMPMRSLVRRAIGFLVSALLVTAAAAHSASDAYLTLASDGTQGTSTVVHARWDIALRDLDFVLALDANGDGDITWHELRAREADIASYVYPTLRVTGDKGTCRVNPLGQKVAEHADGAYASLIFDIVCPASEPAVRIDYGLFFAIDPSHRGILVMRVRDRVATTLLEPAHASVNLALVALP